MPFPVGAEVVVRTLANKRGVITEASGGGRYRVRVENVIVSCREQDLTTTEPFRKARAAKKTPAVSPSASSHDAPRTNRLDLHGATVDEALALLVSAIDRAIRDGADRVEVVHGKGKGRVKQAVHRQLARFPSVAAFKLDERNAGVTWVYL